MNDRDILPYIFGSNAKYNRNMCLVSKFWNDMYIKATKLYKIDIIFNKLSDIEFKKIINLPRFCDKSVNIISLVITECPCVKLIDISFSNLKILYIRESNIEGLPLIKTLEKLSMYDCKQINVLPKMPMVKIINMSFCHKILAIPPYNTLESLYIYDCKEIVMLPDISSLKILNIDYCHKISVIPLYGNLEMLSIYRCSKINIIPSFTKLIMLVILGFSNIKSIPDSIADTIVYLCIEKCQEITSLPNFTCIGKLQIVECVNIKEIPLAVQKTLTQLCIKDCENINKLPDFDILEKLTIEKCEIKILPPLINTLEHLDIRICKITELPNFTKLKTLKIGLCDIKSIPSSLADTLEYLAIIYRDKMPDLPIFTKLKQKSIKKLGPADRPADYI